MIIDKTKLIELQMLYYTSYKKASIKKKLQAKNIQIFYCLQFFLITASFLGFSFDFELKFLSFYQVFICNIYIFS